MFTWKKEFSSGSIIERSPDFKNEESSRLKLSVFFMEMGRFCSKERSFMKLELSSYSDTI